MHVPNLMTTGVGLLLGSVDAGIVVYGFRGTLGYPRLGLTRGRVTYPMSGHTMGRLGCTEC